uniref:Uncharacterized protein n=1 Tax=Rhodnius prolixus TaxID=13249 RepID=T1HUH0_RHOPR
MEKLHGKRVLRFYLLLGFIFAAVKENLLNESCQIFIIF